jgi:hypothetical protein
MPFCPQCESGNNAGDEFCRSCGAPLTGDLAGPTGSQRSPTANLPSASYSLSPAHPAQLPPWPKNLRLPLLVLGLIGIVLICGAAVFFVFSGSPLPAGSQNSTGVSGDSGTLPVNGLCSEGLSRCSGKCVDLTTDPDNCGACGFTVPFGETCIQGQFSSSLVQKNKTTPVLTGTAVAGRTGTTVAERTGTTAAVGRASCPADRDFCSGTCRDLQTDAGNCGYCGNACSSGQTCENGRCTFWGTSTPGITATTSITITPDLSCSYGEIPCGSSCVNVFSDKKNCGVCGRACGALEICRDARCGPACTDSSTTLCGDNCVDLDTDMNNCGACGTECKTFLPNAKGSLCMNGECIISGCKTDYADCNKNIIDGCEANLRLDAGNCGSCGTKCTTGKVCYNKKCTTPAGT